MIVWRGIWRGSDEEGEEGGGGWSGNHTESSAHGWHPSFEEVPSLARVSKRGREEKDAVVKKLSWRRAQQATMKKADGIGPL